MNKHWTLGLPVVVALMLGAPWARADDTVVSIYLATQSGPGAAIGVISIGQTDKGAAFKLDLRNLPPGPHGFHVHENGECGPIMMNGIASPAGAAGSHWDPDQTNKHAGPEGEGHMGDLPLLQVAADGTATQTLIAPRIKDIALLRGHALVIHVHGDNYSDQPEPAGGGGARIACGVVQP